MVRDRILYVNTDSSALASELTLRGKELVKRLNRELGTPIIQRILFKQGRVAVKEEKGLRNRCRGEESELRRSEAAPRLSAGTLKRIDSAVVVIEEEELREIMKRFLRAAARRSRGVESD
jgi:hypothetical protein